MKPPEPPYFLLREAPREARILILRLRSIGDIVLLTPALSLLKEWRPDLRVSVLVESRFRELLEMIPEVDETLGLSSGSGGNRSDRLPHLLATLRKRKFRACVNLHGGPTSAILTALSGARWKIGFAHFRSRWIYNIVVPDARDILHQERIHTAEHQACALFWMGLPQCELPRTRLVVQQENREWWETERALLDLPSDAPYAVIHPPALYSTKQWAPEKFAQLGRHLEENAGVASVYSAGPGETPVLDSVEQASRGPIRRLENATLGQFAAALGGARLFVGNDSGPAHIAQALGVPSVVIFGSSSSGIWGPWPRTDEGRQTIVVQNPFSCNPCRGDRCYRYEQPECILSVTLEQVTNAAEHLLKISDDRSATGSASTTPRSREIEKS